MPLMERCSRVRGWTVCNDAPVQVLGIEVSEPQLMHWLNWLMPGLHPYLLPVEVAQEAGLVEEPERLTMELRDAFWIYGDQPEAVCWLTRAQARVLPERVRRDQPQPHRWRSSDPRTDLQRLVRYLEDGRRRSRHEQASSHTWSRAESLLPGARQLAGTFPGRSGPNCFGTVMAAAGVPDAAGVWMQREPFEQWLLDTAVPGGRDDEVGTVLVWRSADHVVQHAAVTIGDGLGLHKPSQGWQSPTKILTVRELKFSARTPGNSLHRYSIG